MATIASIGSIVHADTVEAYNLYVWNGSEFVQPQGTEQSKFHYIGTTDYLPDGQVAGSGKEQLVACAYDTEGNLWYGPDALKSPQDPSQGWRKISGYHSCTAAYGEVTKTGPSAYRINGGSSLIGIDRNYDLWYTATSTPVILPDNKTILPHQINQWYQSAGKDPSPGILLLGSPRATTSQTSVYQTPQTGDPAASIWQKLPYLIVIAAFTGALLAVSRQKFIH